MKKNEAWYLFWEKRRLKTLLIMKFLALFLFVSTLQLSAKVYSQVAKVTLNLENVSFEQLVKELEVTTGYTFLYREAQVENLKDLNIKCKKESLDKVLDQCLQGSNLTYQLVDKTVVIVPGKENPSVPQVKKRKVEGIVRDVRGETLPGVAVLLSGTTVGVATDVNGKYILEFPDQKDAVLLFSFVGMKTQRVPVGDRNHIDVVMESEQQQMEEVVVVAYGTRKKGTIAGSVSVVGGEKLEKIPTASFDQALQGSIPGMMVLSNTGEPSAAATFQIRGTNSINAGTAPLFILDGIAISSDDFSAINPSDIESISVLKDASSTSIYGARAANGVVVITTRRGRMGDKGKINLRTQIGFSTLAYGKWNQMNTSERLDYEEEIGLRIPGSYDREALEKINIDWRDKVYNDAAPFRNYELSASGAGSVFNYFISGGYYSQEGVAVGSDFSRWSLRANLEAKVTDWFKMGTNTALSYEKIEEADEGEYTSVTPISASRFMLPYWDPYTADGEIASVSDGSWLGTNQNPLEWLANNPMKRNKMKLITSIFAEIRPIEGLVFRTIGGVDGMDLRTTQKSNSQYVPNNGSGRVGNGFQRNYNLTWTNTLTYNFDLNALHNFNFLLGQEAVSYEAEAFSAVIRGQNNDKLLNMSTGTDASNWNDSKTGSTYLSVFFRGEYNFNQKYYADFSVRRDGSSKFGKNSRWANFWSVGLMWNAKAESFLDKYEWLSNAQLSFSIGTSGNSSIPSYDHLALVSGGAKYDGMPGIAVTSRGNENLTWEKLLTTNVALKLGFLNRINVEVEFYNKNTSDMLMEVPTTFLTGYAYKWDNIGEMLNRGVEFNVNVDVIRRGDWRWNINANASYNHNEITELYNGQDEYVISTTNLMLKVGHSYGEFYTNRFYGVYPVNGDALWLDKNGKITNVFDENDKVLVGKSCNAPWQGGFGTTVSWKGLSLNAVFSWVADRWMMNNDRYFDESNGTFASMNQSRKLLYNRWKNPGEVAEIPRHGVASQFDTRLLEDASFLRLKNLTLGYNLPANVLKKTRVIERAYLYAQAQNLLTFTKFQGMDPESNMNMYQAAYPLSRQFSVGLEIGF